MHWLWDGSPQWKPWWFTAAVSALLCRLLGHHAAAECGDPEHDFCVWCKASTPGQAARPPKRYVVCGTYDRVTLWCRWNGVHTRDVIQAFTASDVRKLHGLVPEQIEVVIVDAPDRAVLSKLHMIGATRRRCTRGAAA